MDSYRNRPVVILGGGVMGRLIAASWAAAGYDINVRDPNAEQGAQCVKYVADNIHAYPAAKTNTGRFGTVTVYEDLATAVKDAWLIIESIPERIELKTATFAQLEREAPSDAILSTNSSSYKSSEMLGAVQHESTKRRILNSHYFKPPEVMLVELMTCGFTDPKIISFLAERQKEVGLMPYVARKESSGFIFNRLWAAIKRETLSILAEGVSTPNEIDSMWMVMMRRSAPCMMMDEVGLDTVALIESHYVQERKLSPEKTVDFLQKNYLAEGKLGHKSTNGGLYPREPKLLVLDLGLAAPGASFHNGSILEVSADGKSQKTLVTGQSLPDGIDYDDESQRMFWTCMGTPGLPDGEIYSANRDGSDVRAIVPKGAINTPKQLVVEPTTQKLYFCDREGMRVMRCNYDGSGLEVLVQNGDWSTEGTGVVPKWCVGITVVPELGRFFWTQKGPSKSNQGRIFCARIDSNEDPASRTDIRLVVDRLPEPIDLEFDLGSNTLYWTDRGELPFGNTVNCAKLDPASGLTVAAADGKKHRILTMHYNEAIGIRLHVAAGFMYVTDLSGTIYRCRLDGSTKERILCQYDSAFSGLTIV